MRTRAALGGVFASLVVLVVGWQAGTAALGATGTGTTVTSSQPLDSGTTTTTTTTTTSGATDGTFTGSSVSTRFGNVQVAITVSGGTIADVTALQLTDADGRSRQISNRAAPVLREEVLSAQSANVSNVGGATYTSDAYLQSLQSALDQAGL